ncbi:DNA-3-methyladenine glycosylase I [uncultured Oscillibacter sp.]|uniref:DNA-3-methyladenine glycosylase I n=1 Tax=uncultured Oscillibacter sp. TaxID=876091 RepID=UPI0025CBF4EA|nr:DNA-3-methyladenine glycosylase I [uncultured Oscillibacter sp.]
MCKTIRCPWAGDLPLSVDYHDREWGRPVHEDGRLFEMLVLEGMQAGLSWNTVLKKRAAFRRAFEGFDPGRVARYGEAEVQALLADEGIIRNRLKINAAVTNAQAFLRVQEQYGSFDRFLWAYVGGVPVVNHWRTMEEIPAETPLSRQISRDLKHLGFRFVGPTIVYAFMQAVGMVNDHLTDCFVYRELQV